MRALKTFQIRTAVGYLRLEEIPQIPSNPNIGSTNRYMIQFWLIFHYILRFQLAL